MIEKTILDYLNSELSVPAYMERPLDSPEEFVLIERTGGTITDVVIGSGTFAIQTYAESLYEAAALANEVVLALYGMVHLPEVSRVSIDGLYNFTDVDTKDYRYQVVARIIYYHNVNA